MQHIFLSASVSSFPAGLESGDKPSVEDPMNHAHIYLSDSVYSVVFQEIWLC